MRIRLQWRSSLPLHRCVYVCVCVCLCATSAEKYPTKSSHSIQTTWFLLWFCVASALLSQTILFGKYCSRPVFATAFMALALPYYHLPHFDLMRNRNVICVVGVAHETNTDNDYFIEVDAISPISWRNNRNNNENQLKISQQWMSRTFSLLCRIVGTTLYWEKTRPQFWPFPRHTLEAHSTSCGHCTSSSNSQNCRVFFQ